MSVSERDAGHADPERIQRQIEETRSHMTSTLTELERKLSARQLTNDVFDAMREAVIGTGDGSKVMIEFIKKNPVPAALIGLGIGWMLFGATRPRAATHRAATPPETEHRRGANGGANGSGMASRVSAATGHYAARVGDTASSYAGRARSMAEDNPLAIGAVGLVLGGLIGALLPMTRRESEWFGSAQAQFVDQAEELGRETLERARDVAEHAGRAAVDVVERELGVTKDPTRPPG
jgi:hypothetical protein